MKCVTRFELATKSKDELHIILRNCFNQAAGLHIHSQDYKQLMASAEKVKNELNSRVLRP